jgi:8-oxo-dGTP pyrophosphatase MutT (NUDIX family)
MAVARKALGSAGALLTPDGRVLLVRRAYPPHDWVMPGGNADAGESPVTTLIREILEETGLTATPTRLTGVYYHPDHRLGEFIHFVFQVPISAEPAVRIDPSEIAAWGLFAAQELPEPMSPSTRIRLADALRPRDTFLPADLPPASEP